MNGTVSLDGIAESGPDDPLGSLDEPLGGLDDPLRPRCRCTEAPEDKASR